MRDIRSDLRERLEAIEKKKASLRSQITALEQQESGVAATLQLEEERFGKTKTFTLTAPEEDSRSPLSRLVVDILKEADQPLGLEDVKKMAVDRFDFGKQSPGRTLHYALVGMTKNGHLDCTGRKENRKYQLKNGAGVPKNGTAQVQAAVH